MARQNDVMLAVDLLLWPPNEEATECKQSWWRSWESKPLLGYEDVHPTCPRALPELASSFKLSADFRLDTDTIMTTSLRAHGPTMRKTC